MTGVKPTLQASAMRTAQMERGRLSARADASLTWVKAEAKLVCACISRTTSGRSMSGRRCFTRSRKVSRLFGSSKGFAAGKNRKLEEKAEQMGYQSCQKTEQTSMLRGCVGWVEHQPSHSYSRSSRLCLISLQAEQYFRLFSLISSFFSIYTYNNYYTYFII